MEEEDSEATDLLVKAVMSCKRGTWRAEDLVALANALAKLKLEPNTGVVRRLAEELIQSKIIDQLYPRGLCLLLHAFSTFYSLSTPTNTLIFDRHVDFDYQSQLWSKVWDGLATRAEFLASRAPEHLAGPGTHDDEGSESIRDPEGFSAQGLGLLTVAIQRLPTSQISEKLERAVLAASPALSPSELDWQAISNLLEAVKPVPLHHTDTGHRDSFPGPAGYHPASLSLLRKIQGAIASGQVTGPPPTALTISRVVTVLAQAPKTLWASQEEVDAVFIVLRRHVLRSRVASFDPTSIAKVIQGFIFTRQADPALLRRMFWEMKQHPVGTLDAKTSVQILNALVQTSFVLREEWSIKVMFRFLSRSIRARSGCEFDASVVSRLLYAVARKRVRDGALYLFTSGIVLSLPEESFSAANVARVVHAYSRAGIWDDRLFRHMSIAVRKLDESPMTFEEVAQIAGAFANAETRRGSKYRDGSIFRFVAGKLDFIEPAPGDSRHIAKILNAFARAGVWDETLFRKLSRVIMRLNPEDVPVGDIATMVNAFSQATTRHGSTLRLTAVFLKMSKLASSKNAQEFTARDVSSIVNALARAGIWDDMLFRKMSLFVRVMPKEDLSLREAARILSALSLARARTGSRFRDSSVFRLVSARIILDMPSLQPSYYSAGDIAALAHAYTRAEIFDVRLFKILSTAARSLQPSQVNPKDIAELVSAFTRMQERDYRAGGMRDGALFMHMSTIAKSKDPGLLTAQPRTIANIVNAFAKAGIWDEDLFRLMSRAAKRVEPKDLDVQDCAAIVGSFAKAQLRQGAKLRDGALFRRMSLVAQSKRSESFTPRTVANIASAFARAKIWDRNLFEYMSRLACVVRRRGGEPLSDFKPQELASISWALAKAEAQYQEASSAPRGDRDSATKGFFVHLSNELKRRGLRDFKPQEFSNILWAFTTLGLDSPWLFRMASEELLQRNLTRFNAQDLANTAWAFAAGRYRVATVFAAIGKESIRKVPSRGGESIRLKSFDSQQMAMLAVAFAKAGVNHPRLYTEIQREMLKRCVHPFHSITQDPTLISNSRASKLVFKPSEAVGCECASLHDLINVGWACTVASCAMQKLQRKIAESTEDILEDLPIPLLVQLGQIVLGNAKSSKAGKTAVKITGPNTLLDAPQVSHSVIQSTTPHRQRSSVTAFLDLDNVVGQSRDPEYTVSLLLALRKAQDQRIAPYSSKLHEGVSKVLKRIGVDHINEYAIFGGVYHIDIVCADGVAIEVDGPSHFYRNSNRFTAETIFKQRVLGGMGWKVRSLSYFEWEKTKGKRDSEKTRGKQGSDHQVRILSKLLAETGYPDLQSDTKEK